MKPVRLSSLEMRRVCAARAPTMMPQETNHPPARSALLDSMCRCKVLPRRAPVDGRRMSSLHPCLSPFFPFSAGARAIVSGAALQAHSSSMPRLLYVIFAFCLLMPSILHRRACSRVWPAVVGARLRAQRSLSQAPRFTSPPSALPVRHAPWASARPQRQQTKPVTKETANTASRNCHASIGIDKSRVHHCIDDSPIHIHTHMHRHDRYASQLHSDAERVFCLLKGIAEGTYNTADTRKPLGQMMLIVREVR